MIEYLLYTGSSPSLDAVYVEPLRFPPTTARINAFASTIPAAPHRRRFRRPRDRCNSLRGHRLPPPPVAGLARASSAGSLGSPRYRRRDSRPILQALVTGAASRHPVHTLDFFHAFGFSLWDDLSSLCYCCFGAWLAQVGIRTYEE